MSVTFNAGTVTWNEDFQAVVHSATSPEEVEVNMSNGNAVDVSAALGIDLEPDWCGSMPAEDFLGRVLVALAIAPADEGMPSYEHAGPGARMIQGARPAGYLQDRLGQLHQLADWAVNNGAEIQWG